MLQTNIGISIMESDRDDNTNTCINEFITLANTMKDRGISITDVSWSLMNASAIYATYSVSGNTGGLKESGVEKVVDAYRDIMSRVQNARRQELVDAGATIDDIH